MTSLALWIFLGIIACVAGLVLYIADLPGHRRKHPDPRYHGPERRQNSTVCDFIQQPAFRNARCPGCGRIKRSQNSSQLTCPYCNYPDKTSETTKTTDTSETTKTSGTSESTKTTDTTETTKTTDANGHNV